MKPPALLFLKHGVNQMYKLFHWLFGWDYVLIRSQYVRRVKFTPNGRAYVVLYSTITFVDVELPTGMEKLTW